MKQPKVIRVKYMTFNKIPNDHNFSMAQPYNQSSESESLEVKVVINQIVSYSNMLKAKSMVSPKRFYEYGEIRCSNGDFYFIEKSHYTKILDILLEYFEDYDYTKTEQNEI